MKEFNIKEIEKSIKVLQEVINEIKPILKIKPAYYAKLSGYSRQYIHQFCNNTKITELKKNTDPRRVIHLYKVIQESEK